MSKKISTILKYDVIFEEAEEGGYFVSVPSLPGCISEGDTFEEAKENITEAITCYLESVVIDKAEIPYPAKNIFIGTIEIPAIKLSFLK